MKGRKEGELDELTTPTVTGSKREWTEHLSNFKDLSKPI